METTQTTITCPSGHPIGDGWCIVEMVPHFWRFSQIAEDGTLMFDGEFDWAGDAGTGETLQCYCGLDVPMPENVDHDYY